MVRKRVLKTLSLTLTLALSLAFAHSGGADSIWESQMFAYFVASLVGGTSYLIMVWETPAERKRKQQERGNL